MNFLYSKTRPINMAFFFYSDTLINSTTIYNLTDYFIFLSGQKLYYIIYNLLVFKFWILYNHTTYK